MFIELSNLVFIVILFAMFVCFIIKINDKFDFHYQEIKFLQDNNIQHLQMIVKLSKDLENNNEILLTKLNTRIKNYHRIEEMDAIFLETANALESLDKRIQELEKLIMERMKKINNQDNIGKEVKNFMPINF